MQIKKLVTNNIKEVSTIISSNESIGIGGLSGSGKSSFCDALYQESIKRVVSLLPKSEYRFLFGEVLHSNFSAQGISELPLIFYLGKSSFSSNPRSTVGTHTGVFKEVRERYAKEYDLNSDFFSFNNSLLWCDSCRGRGSTAGKECRHCRGMRYSEKVRDYPILINKQKKYITEVNSLTVEELLEIGESFDLSDTKKNILSNMLELNIGYLSLDRVMSTLSGGEAVRVLLSEFMAQCKNSLIIIDEVSIGLDRNSLISVLEKIKKIGENNQIWLIDHSDIVLNSTEKNIFFGPGSGKDGGKIVETSPRPKPIPRKVNEEEPKDFYVFKNLQKRNIEIADLRLPKNRITSFTGESGCGKSTLINDCIIPFIKKNYKGIECELIGQDRNQSITSKSTIATFLDLKKKLDKFGESYLERELVEVRDLVKKDKLIIEKVDMLLKLGLGYLTFDRKVQSLSTGEFQCLHLVAKLTENKNEELVLIFDEPSKGLSQNILNLLIGMMDDILKDRKNTIFIVEHNSFLLSNSDYICDFGKRKKEKILELEVIPVERWKKQQSKNFVEPNITSSMHLEKMRGIDKLTLDIDSRFLDFENSFKGGLLKNLSNTAQWIYKDYKSETIEPLIVLDLEKPLFSKNTFLFEVAGLVNYIIENAESYNTVDFDFYNKENLCECCKGTGYITSFDIESVINDRTKDLWNGLLKDEVMTALKNYNYSKIKFLMKEVQRETNLDISQPFEQMNVEERISFLYGYWDKSFYDKAKKTQRKWRGIIPLILKYMKGCRSTLKETMDQSKKNIVCPICRGTVLSHKKKLYLNKKNEIRNVVVEEWRNVKKFFCNKGLYYEISDIIEPKMKLNDDVSLLSMEKQVRLKIKEILVSSFLGFQIVLKNAAPFMKWIDNDIKRIAEVNKVYLLDYEGIIETKEEILDRYFTEGKITRKSYVYELLGFKKISTEINKIKKSMPCPYCKGSKVIREESIFEGVDVTEIPCRFCEETGINKSGLREKIHGLEVKRWIKGSCGAISSNDILNEIPLMSRISELNKLELYKVKRFKETE